MRPTSGSFFPLSAAAIGIDSGGTGPAGTYVVSRKPGFATQHDLRAAPVLAEHVGPGADRMRAEIAPVRLDDLARDGRRVGHGEHVQEAQIGLLQTDAQRVAIDDLEARESARRSRICPILSALARELVGADDLALDHPQPWTLHRRIEQPLERVRLVGRP